MTKIKVSRDVCQICGRTTDWDSSFGPSNFIVCPICHRDIKSNFNSFDTIYILLTLGKIREKNILTN